MTTTTSKKQHWEFRFPNKVACMPPLRGVLYGIFSKRQRTLQRQMRSNYLDRIKEAGGHDISFGDQSVILTMDPTANDASLWLLIQTIAELQDIGTAHIESHPLPS